MYFVVNMNRSNNAFLFQILFEEKKLSIITICDNISTYFIVTYLSLVSYFNFEVSSSRANELFRFVICSSFLEIRHLLSEKFSASMMKRLFKP